MIIFRCLLHRYLPHPFHPLLQYNLLRVLLIQPEKESNSKKNRKIHLLSEEKVLFFGVKHYMHSKHGSAAIRVCFSSISGFSNDFNRFSDIIHWCLGDERKINRNQKASNYVDPQTGVRIVSFIFIYFFSSPLSLFCFSGVCNRTSIDDRIEKKHCKSRIRISNCLMKN